jgi:mRNA-degrading endonuclease RelE of RelBE toxin-antitoxin system
MPQWKALTVEEKAAVRRTLEVIDEDPIIGAPLFDPLRGYWSFLVDGLRILYRIVADARFVVILSITRR